MTQTTHWFEYGEPTENNNRFEATLRQEYQTGPNEAAKPDNVTKGTISMEALDMLESNEELQYHTHDDGAVMLSGLSEETREEFLATFERNSARAEVLDSGYEEVDEWGFEARVRVRLHNPDGKDVIALHRFRARPKYDDLTSTEEEVNQYISYWWPDAYPSEGDSSFHDADITFEPNADLDDGDALMDECVFTATFDPVIELDGLRQAVNQHSNARQKLGRPQ